MRNREKEVRQKKRYDIKTTTCPMDCGDACSLLATIANGKVVSLQGDPEHPFTQGIMCNKMRHYPERLFGPERLTTPLIRKNGYLEPCSWDNAIDAICARWRSDIKEYGGESIMSWSYSGPMGMFQRNSGDAFFGTLGATSLDRTICATARSFALRESLGVRGVSLPDDFVPGDVILVWSMDPARSHLAFTRRLTQARRQLCLLMCTRMLPPALRTTLVWLRPEGIFSLPCFFWPKSPKPHLPPFEASMKH